MNKKVALISGLVVVGLVGGMLLFSNKKNNTAQVTTDEVIKVEHALGTSEIAPKPERVVVFDFAVLDAMEVLEVDGVVGVPQSASIPDYLSKYEGSEYTNVGGLKEPDLEKINELDPDLIIINGRQHSFYDKLNKIAPTISMAKEEGKYLVETTRNMEVLGDIFDKESKVDEELDKINDRIKEINKEITEKGYDATTLMASDGKLSVFGADSRFGIIYNELGFKNTDENVESANHGQDVSFEYIASQDSDYILVVDKSVVVTGDKEQKTAQEILNNELINNTKASKEGNLIYLDTHSWYISDGGLMSTNKMLDDISKAINK